MNVTIEDLKGATVTGGDLTNPVFPYLTLSSGHVLILNWDGVASPKRLVTTLDEHKAFREQRVANVEATVIAEAAKAEAEVAKVQAAITEAEKVFPDARDEAAAVVTP